LNASEAANSELVEKLNVTEAANSVLVEKLNEISEESRKVQELFEESVAYGKMISDSAKAMIDRTKR